MYFLHELFDRWKKTKFSGYLILEDFKCVNFVY